jgi:hypothetical protein
MVYEPQTMEIGGQSTMLKNSSAYHAIKTTHYPIHVKLF